MHEYEAPEGFLDGVSVAKALGQEPGSVFKTLVTVGQSREYYVCEIPVDKELDLKKIQDSPGIICYVVQPEDTLWDIAKKYYTTPEYLKKLNQLKEEIRPGEKLLLVKSAAV